jgi:hypothetical protein
MAHFAKLNSDNIVVEVIALDNSLEANGSQYLAQHYGGTWIQTSYNSNIRGKFAGLGDLYDAESDIFAPCKSGHYIETKKGVELVFMTDAQYDKFLKDNTPKEPPRGAVE